MVLKFTLIKSCAPDILQQNTLFLQGMIPLCRKFALAKITVDFSSRHQNQFQATFFCVSHVINYQMTPSKTIDETFNIFRSQTPQIVIDLELKGRGKCTAVNLKSEIRCPGNITGILYVRESFHNLFSFVVIYQNIPKHLQTWYFILKQFYAYNPISKNWMQHLNTLSNTFLVSVLLSSI